ncbi:uncharacterized protein LOC123556488 [Mercenaria mercenaria]|uniref:uncharacterized protein LOC123556488 n=1 Tax=Mercenaria mercenaria TaxID=6596 RepID=UPI00234F8909|nr:uncharacterized protein LOC123556488 [Mercenaria mercenaria]
MKIDFKSLCLINVCFQVWIVTETQGRPGFCGTNKPVVRICHGGELFLRSSVFIDTSRVPKNQQSSCECTISPAAERVQLVFWYLDALNVSGIQSIQFEINGIVLNSSTESRRTILNDETKLTFSTTKQFNSRGVCLRVATDPQQYSSSDVDGYFNISCAEQTSRTIQVDLGTPTPLAVSIVLSVTGALLLISGAVILLVIVKRYRLAKKTIRNESEHPPSSSDYTSQGQGRNNYNSGEQHYLAMTNKVSNVGKNGEYEMVGVCKNRQLQKLAEDQGPGQKNNMSHIYVSMHSPLDFRGSSRTNVTVPEGIELRDKERYAEHFYVNKK